ncbi:D-ribose pyranase [Sulfoacidibacillus thermotolerans]|uniref:D-ribose pyranase n=1 Tax=Sulfoacidibacillus thermotolerans TaxID=1765684 RepID=A0A2U3D780_SULT2|nr:D-ribose pyranase [Sulfoacidibacillus thermotolerans]PWI57135.1 hypothetical protein BM613_10295 [Sulfoacidibacillus thermotolerans]
MKKSGILHGELSKVIAELGHGQSIVLADYGLPVPREVRVIDLALKVGMPTVFDVLETILEEMYVESAVLAAPLQELHPQLCARLCERIAAPVTFVTHEEFKNLLPFTHTVVRTGEWTSYANVLLRSGVLF